MRATRLAVVAAVALVATITAGCDSAKDDAADNAGAMATPATSAPMAATQFGAACSAVPTDPADPGSFDGMAKDPVATAASHNPVLKTLVSAVTTAQLGDTLNSAPAITVFAPINTAFAKIPAATMSKVMADKATLTKILTYHVVGERLTPDQLAGSHKTLQGGSVTVAGSGTNFTVNGNAAVVCGNVQTANATVYLIDTVLMPPAS